jgi:hypothetical protein
MSGKIFINYRRDDEPGFTQALLGRLEQVFPPERLFIDVDNIPAGDNFIQVLESQVAQCDVLLAVIGNRWLDAKDERGCRRLDDPNDFVSIEIESALRHGKRIIPVLVHQARMPRSDELPEALRPLVTRNAVRLTHERFRSDVQGLVTALQGALDDPGISRSRSVDAMIQESPKPKLLRWSWRTLAALLVFGAGSIVLIGVWFANAYLMPTAPHFTSAQSVSKGGGPIEVGVWSWFNPTGSDVEIRSNGSVVQSLNGQQVNTGQWVKKGESLEISWINGYVDELRISPDGRFMSGYNRDGAIPPVYRK